jgi:hypothetical protein
MEMKEKVRVAKFGSAYALEEYDDGIWEIMCGEYAPPISKREAEKLCKAMNKCHAILKVTGLDRMTLQEAVKRLRHEGLSKEQIELLKLISFEAGSKPC